MSLLPEDIKLHQALIRYAKGMLSAWELWVRARTPPPAVIQDPGPEKTADIFKNPEKHLRD